jgi:hypothetical protein
MTSKQKEGSDYTKVDLVLPYSEVGQKFLKTANDRNPDPDTLTSRVGTNDQPAREPTCAQEPRKAQIQQP